MPRTYSCNRCGYRTSQRVAMRRHCARKRPCDPVESEADADFLHIVADEVDARRGGVLTQQVTNNVTNVGNYTVNTVNTVNITLPPCAFGDEDLSWITQEVAERLILRNAGTPASALAELHKLIFRPGTAASTVMVADSGRVYVRGVETVGGRQVPVYTQRVPEDVTRAVCCKSVCVMDGLWMDRRKAEAMGIPFARPMAEPRMAAAEVEAWDDLVIEGDNAFVRALRDDESVAFAQQAMSDAQCIVTPQPPPAGGIGN